MCRRNVFNEGNGSPHTSKTDLTYLANLCHNCGECLYACQYAPPHEFGINVPQALAEIRLRSYGKFVHGIYRTAALVKYASDRETG